MADLQRKTANLFDYNTVTFGKYIDSNGNEQASSGTGEQSLNHSDYIAINAGITYAFKCDKPPIDSATFNAFCWFDSNKQFVKRETFDAGAVDPYILGTAAAPINAAYLIMNYRGLHGDTAMLNTGSNHLPYEPYWQHSLRKLTTATDTITTLPVDIYADGNSATVGLKGNTVQSGTPTPDSPIIPQGTGERTGNLFDKDATNTNNGYISGYYLYYDGTPIQPSSSLVWNISEYIELTSGYIALSGLSTMSSGTPAICFYDSSKNYIIGYNYGNGEVRIYEVPSGTKYCRISIDERVINQLMLNLGSIPKPYEPYGYKIPISSAGQTTPVYLGEVQTTRTIKKLVLTGEEPWGKSENGIYSYFALRLGDSSSTFTTAVCTHYENVDVTKTSPAVGFMMTASSRNLRIRTNDVENVTVTDFASYLAQQYANGTPVTVWYVLETPETGIINEPLMKIGDYADEVSGIVVPTITGKDTFDVLTTLKPSEVSLGYTGWHDATVKEWDGSQWNE